MPKLKCPVCGRQFEQETSRRLPFCSDRCSQIDLGRWLGERYSVPHLPREDSDPDEEAPLA